MYRLAGDLAQLRDLEMIDIDPIRPGDLVRDRKLGLIWTVRHSDPEGQLELECNGVIASAARWEVELLKVSL